MDNLIKSFKFSFVGTLVSIVFLVSCLHPARANFLYERFNQNSCKNSTKIIPIGQLDPRFTPKQELDQGDHGTCFGFSAYYMVQYLYNQQHNVTDSSREFNILDVIGKSCRKVVEPDAGGATRAALHNLRQDDLNELTYKNFPAKYDEFLKNVPLLKNYAKIGNGRSEDCCNVLKSSVLTQTALKLITDRGLLSRLHDEFVSPEHDTFPFRAIESMNRGEKDRLPPYNINVYRSDNPFEILSEMRTLFSSPNPMPVNINYCTQGIEKKGGCTSRHAVTVKGVRQICCKNQCHDEWEIVNSWGNDTEAQGWLNASPYAESIAELKSATTSVQPCSPKPVKDQPLCTNYIHSDRPMEDLEITHDLNSRSDFRNNSPSTNDKNSWRPSDAAVYNGDINAVRYLLSKGVMNIEQSNKLGKSPLEQALIRGHSDIVHLLLESGADPTKRTQDGRTFLELANSTQSKEISKLIEGHLSRSKNVVNAIDEHGWTPLTRAARKGDSLAVKALLGVGADVTRINSKGQSPLILAAVSGNADLIDLLIQKGADINSKTFTGITALQGAAAQGRINALEALLKHGAKVESYGAKNQTALNLASKKGQLKAVQFLAEKGANLSTKDDEGYTPLHNAIREGHDDIAQFLMQKKVSIDPKSFDGITPLALAVSQGRKSSVELLLNAGANPQSKTYSGETIRNLALKAGDPEILRMIDARLNPTSPKIKLAAPYSVGAKLTHDIWQQTNNEYTATLKDRKNMKMLLKGIISYYKARSNEARSHSIEAGTLAEKYSGSKEMWQGVLNVEAEGGLPLLKKLIKQTKTEYEKLDEKKDDHLQKMVNRKQKYFEVLAKTQKQGIPLSDRDQEYIKKDPALWEIVKDGQGASTDF